MRSEERRRAKRFTLNYPVLMAADKGSEHLAEIIDAGSMGMRVRLTGQSNVGVGRDVVLFCRPSTSARRDGRTLRCRVAWEDPDNLEVGLRYIQ